MISPIEGIGYSFHIIYFLIDMNASDVDIDVSCIWFPFLFFLFSHFLRQIEPLYSIEIINQKFTKDWKHYHVYSKANMFFTTCKDFVVSIDSEEGKKERRKERKNMASLMQFQCCTCNVACSSSVASSVARPGSDHVKNRSFDRK